MELRAWRYTQMSTGWRSTAPWVIKLGQALQREKQWRKLFTITNIHTHIQRHTQTHTCARRNFVMNTRHIVVANTLGGIGISDIVSCDLTDRPTDRKTRCSLGDFLRWLLPKWWFAVTGWRGWVWNHQSPHRNGPLGKMGHGKTELRWCRRKIDPRDFRSWKTGTRCWWRKM